MKNYKTDLVVYLFIITLNWCITVNQICFGCKPGYFGPSCDSRCSVNCPSNTCNPVTGNCSPCSNEYIGPRCDVKCNCKECHYDPIENKAMCAKCDSNEYVHESGVMCQSCPSNCSRCENGTYCTECASGYFGRTCSEKCIENCARCENRFQCVKCKDGYYNETCQDECPENCVSCTNSTYCDRCEYEHFGDKCSSCPRHLYGEKCHKRCNCDFGCRRDGLCYSSFRYFFYRRRHCENNRFGKHCKCNDSMTHCRLCEDDVEDPCMECKTGWFGELCKKNCSNSCNPKLGCSKGNGHCLREESEEFEPDTAQSLAEGTL